MKKIVAALSMDEKSDAFVIEKAEELKKRMGAKVIYVHAPETPFLDFVGSSSKVEDETRIKDEIISLIRKSADISDSDVIVSFANAWELILKTILQHNATLVILGNTSKNKAVFYLGSTAKKVLEKSGIPVFIARDKPLDEKILIPTDLGDYTMSAKHVKKFLNSNAQATYVYANTVSFGVTVPYTTLAVHSLEFVQEEIKKNIEDFETSRNDAPTITLEIENSISETIKEYAQENGYTLTVLASKNIAGLSPIIFGSTASKIAQTVDTNLLITFIADEEE